MIPGLKGLTNQQKHNLKATKNKILKTIPVRKGALGRKNHESIRVATLNKDMKITLHTLIMLFSRTLLGKTKKQRQCRANLGFKETTSTNRELNKRVEMK